jgi:predicted RNase H-like nuclease (RuvC/YqgF family)
MVNKTSTASTVLGWSLAFAVLAPLAVHAQPAPKVVSRDELRACMNSESDLAKQREGLEARTKQLNEEAAAVRAEEEELAAEQKRVEQSSMPLARDRFDRKIRQHNARVSGGKEQSEALKAALEDLKKGMEAHNAKCGGIAFDPADKAAILKEQGK